jgi:hypothetical protein
VQSTNTQKDSTNLIHFQCISKQDQQFRGFENHQIVLVPLHIFHNWNEIHRVLTMDAKT